MEMYSFWEGRGHGYFHSQDFFQVGKRCEHSCQQYPYLFLNFLGMCVASAKLRHQLGFDEPCAQDINMSPMAALPSLSLEVLEGDEMTRMLNLAAFIALTLTLISTSNAADGRNIYKQTCATCHTVGSTSEAPKLGVHADWRARLTSGRANLLHSVMKGKGAMPPKGGNASISDAQANAALDYMLSKIEEGRE